MAPDFEYFLHLAPVSGFGHTLAGAFVLSLPLALLVLWLFHFCVKALAISLMPRSLQLWLLDCLAPFPFFEGTRFLLIVCSLLIGIATHIAWDSFTHSGAWIVQHWSFLSETSKLPMLGAVQNYKILQHVSTALGLTVLCIWFIHWCRNTPFASPVLLSGLRRFSASRKLFVVAQIIVIALAGVFVRIAASLDLSAHSLSFATFAGKAICTFIALIWWQLVIYGILSRTRQGFRPAEPL
jgi:hypothetical protein